MSGAMDWSPLERELAHWRAAGHAARLWLRDDDAVAVTPALERLSAIAGSAGIPVVLAVIPARAEPALADFVARRPGWRVAVHGFAHLNHAPAGEKKAELGLHRPCAAVLADIARGIDWLDGLFAGRLAPMLVPPWNRIDPGIVAELARLGVEVLSVFGPEPQGLVPPPRRLNTHLDLVDWRGGRHGFAHHLLIDRLALCFGEARLAGGRPVGILGHHLVHDETAWGFLEGLARFLAGRRDCAWWSPEWTPAGAPRGA